MYFESNVTDLNIKYSLKNEIVNYNKKRIFFNLLEINM